MIICIESFHKDALQNVLTEVQNQLSKKLDNIRMVQFPSDGPFGHQIRVVDNKRLELQPLPEHLLHMVDRMDFFLNPTNGLNHAINSLDCLILSGSQYKEAALCDDPELLQWILEINSNIPEVTSVFWLVDNSEESPTILNKATSFQAIQLNYDYLDQTAALVVNAIEAKVKHG